MADPTLARQLRTLRERRGWTRETLAHRAGVSWAAIAQIEGGRRTDPRLSTVTALADALGVTVGQLSRRSWPPDRVEETLRHQLLLYATDDEFVEATLPFLVVGLEKGDAVLAVTGRSRIRRLRRSLGVDARRVTFRESTAWYTSARSAIDSYRSFVGHELGQGRPWVRVIGEPVWAERSSSEVRAWTRYEAMLNLSLAGTPLTIMCPYDTRAVSASIVADARRTHPQVMSETGPVASEHFHDPVSFLLAP
jgi:transcriptional regulator with XRE-family HTH domain